MADSNPPYLSRNTTFAERGFAVWGGWHWGPMSQQRRQRFKGGRRSKEKISQKSVGKQIQEKKHLPFWEYDMRDPWGSSILNYFKAAGDQNKKGNSQKLIRVKNKSIKGNFYCS
jgi:hypothetical protein